MSLPYLLFADKQGRIFSHPYLKIAAQSAKFLVLPPAKSFIPLPQGCRLFFLPGRRPVGFDEESGKFEVVEEWRGQKVFAVGAFLIPAYLRLFLPANLWQDKKALLPLWPYSAVGFYGGRYFVAAMRVDRRRRQSPRYYRDIRLKKRIESFLRKFPHNRLFFHFANCAYNYHCLAATNLFMKRWEAPLVVSSRCNANCWGCLSYQKNLFPASHQRISFRPHPEEVAEVALVHFANAKNALASFGQGCEGEPLLEAETIVKAIRIIRKRTSCGTLHLNTNASLPLALEEVCAAGLDSLRVSLNSAQPEFYQLYFRPRDYNFSDVVKSIKIAKKRGVFVALNLLLFPGFNDTKPEIEALVKFIKRLKIDMVQMRNLSIDSDFFSRVVLANFSQKPQGLDYLYRRLKEIKGLKIGYFNLPRADFRSFQNL